MDILPGLACDQFFNRLKMLDFDKGGVPDFNENKRNVKINNRVYDNPPTNAYP